MMATCKKILMAPALLAGAQKNWTSSVTESGGRYEAVFQWEHDGAMSFPTTGVINPKEGRCDESSEEVAPDGQKWWMPRFNPRTVTADVTEKSGIQFASVDWTPCGHKNIVICHAESHYDFHLYYHTEAAMQNPKYGCVDSMPHCPMIEQNDLFFRMMANNKPITRTGGSVPNADRSYDFCVDPTSGIPFSGIHYGDTGETLEEWKTPVSIIGSHDCQLTFFEPMISWRWITGVINTAEAAWPVWHSGTLTYDQKEFAPLVDSWTVEVGDGRAYADNPCAKHGSDTHNSVADDVCRIKVTVRGDSCPAGGCATPVRNCGSVRNCITNEMIDSSRFNTDGDHAPAVNDFNASSAWSRSVSMAFFAMLSVRWVLLMH